MQSDISPPKEQRTIWMMDARELCKMQLALHTSGLVISKFIALL